MGAARVGSVSTAAVLRWSWLLGVALMAPATLPAGGGELRQPQVRRRSGSSGPLHISSDCPLRLSPLAVAPSLRTLSIGTPCRLLRRWQGDNGQDWLQVQVLSGNCPRGWLRA